MTISKKKLHIFVFLLLVVGCLLFASASTQAAAIKWNGISATKLTMYTDNVRILKVKKSASCKNASLIFKSSDPKVAAVSADGILRTISSGKAKITCRAKGVKHSTISLQITVKKNSMKWKNIRNQTVSLEKSRHKTILFIASKKLQVNGRLPACTWSSSNTSIVKVSKTGNVRAVKSGKAVITCKPKSDPAKQISCLVTVTPPNTAANLTDSKPGSTIGSSSSTTPTVPGGSADGTDNGATDPAPEIIPELPDSGNETQNTVQLSSSSAKFIAHRGLSSQAPENTAAAFELAAQSGFWGIETDIRCTADGQYICLHDATFQRVCGVNQKPEDMTLAQIKALTVNVSSNFASLQNNEKALRICTLEEYLQICKTYHVVPVIEIKISCGTTLYLNGTRLQEFEEEDADGAMRDIFSIVSKVMGTDPWVMISFDVDIMKELIKIRHYRNASQVQLQLLRSKFTTDALSWYSVNHVDMDACYSGSDFSLISVIQESGILLNAWTVDDPKIVKDLIDRGVTMITTNRKFWS